MKTQDLLAGQFEGYRGHLTAVAYRMLGSLTEADDVIQEAWLRLAGADSGAIENLGGWLTTTVSRICLDQLRGRAIRGEDPLDTQLPDPVVRRDDPADPEHQAVLADSVGLALLVVLDSLNPAERVAFVLHDMFAVPFDQVAEVIGKTPTATRMLTSRARRRVQAHQPSPVPDRPRQRRAVDAFLTAARTGDFDALLALLDPDVVLHGDSGSGLLLLRGAPAVAGRLAVFQRFATTSRSHPVLVNGLAGLLNTVDGAPISVIGFTVADDRITAIELLSDPARIARLQLPPVSAGPSVLSE
ncbi:sigma-70 family RNA polymerase sigma factor [Nocardia sp. NPDC051832]|uniref:sigma-70 family RNA polymerase sigma factor n=1 Tax=Nocardia sp. NPDC051832 TaxID=3155673 RepID=UPI00343ABE27